MKILRLSALIILLFCGLAFADTHTSVGDGNWSNAATWSPAAVPADGDTVNIDTSGEDIVFDVDHTGWAGLAGLTIASGASLTAATGAGPYYLRMNANLTVNGTFQAGTSEAVPYPTATTFTISGNGTRYISVGAGGKVYFYCAEPTIKYVKTTGALTGGVTTVIPVDTDVTVDSEWAAGKTIGIADIASGSRDVEYLTIAGGGIAAGAITVTVAPTNNKDSGSYLALVTRNIRVIDSTYTSPVFTLNAATTGCYIGAEIRTPRAFSSGVSNTYAGVLATTSTSITSGTSHTVNSVVIHPSIGTASCDGFTLNGYFFGNSIANSSSRAFLYGTGSLVAGCGNASSTSGNCRFLGTINACTIGIYLDAGPIIYGTITNCTSYGVQGGSGHIFANATLNNTIDLYQVQSGLAFNTSFSGATEFSDYGNVAARGQNAYFESQDHDATVNAIKGWPTGGIVTSQTVGPPTGYARWYEHACESATVPCFRQYRSLVYPGETLVVSGLIRIADGEDLTATPPALQIIDYFDDPLVDPTATVLDECEIPDPSGADADWQAVSVSWQNSPSGAPRVVWVRVIAWSDSTPNTNVDEAIEVVDMAAQVSAIYAKLPTNYIMGSSVQTDKDDEIDAILEDTGTTIPALIAGITVDNGAIADEVVAHMDANSTDLDAILADTNELQTDWTNGGRLDLLLDAIKAITDILPELSTTVASATDPNTFVLTAGLDVNDVYCGATIYLKDATDSHWEHRLIIDWEVGRTVTVNEDFGFTPAGGDLAYIWGQPYFPLTVYDALPLPPEQIIHEIDMRPASSGTGTTGGTRTLNAEGDDP